MLVDDDSDVLLVSRHGQSLRFTADDDALRPMGRSTSGVIGMHFRDDDQLLSANVVPALTAEQVEDPTLQPSVFVATEGGYAKRTLIGEYRVQGRGGLGIKVAKLTDEAWRPRGRADRRRRRRGPCGSCQRQGDKVCRGRGAPPRVETPWASSSPDLPTTTGSSPSRRTANAIGALDRSQDESTMPETEPSRGPGRTTPTHEQRRRKDCSARISAPPPPSRCA